MMVQDVIDALMQIPVEHRRTTRVRVPGNTRTGYFPDEGYQIVAIENDRLNVYIAPTGLIGEKASVGVFGSVRILLSESTPYLVRSLVGDDQKDQFPLRG